MAYTILECDPANLLLPGNTLAGAGRRDRRRDSKSAAALAREQYASALGGRSERRNNKSAAQLAFEQYAVALQAGSPSSPADLLDLTAASEVTGASSSASVDERASGLWPGDVVLARYGTGDFYRARTVRLYSKNGQDLADIEWLRPSPGADLKHFVSHQGLDELAHRTVEMENIRRLNGSHFVGGSGSAASEPAAVALQPSPLAERREHAAAVAAPVLLDLLDLGISAEALSAPPAAAGTSELPVSTAAPLHAAPKAQPGHAPLQVLEPVPGHAMPRQAFQPMANATGGAVAASWGPLDVAPTKAERRAEPAQEQGELFGLPSELMDTGPLVAPAAATPQPTSGESTPFDFVSNLL